MESKAAYKLILEIQQLLMSVALKFKADEVEEEILQQLLLVRDSLSTINSQSRPQAKRRGRMHNGTDYCVLGKTLVLYFAHPAAALSHCLVLR